MFVIFLYRFSLNCFQCIFGFHRVFFRAFKSIKEQELGSQSSYGNILRPALDQSNFNTAGLDPALIDFVFGSYPFKY